MSGLVFPPPVRGSTVQMLGLPWPPMIKPRFDEEISLEIECLCTCSPGGVTLAMLASEEPILTPLLAELKAFSYYVGEEETENNVKNIFRCPTCFTPIFISQGDPKSNRMLFFVGCLADPTWLDHHKPDCETFMEDKCAWLPFIAPPSAPSPEPEHKSK
ncbi:hypothetical protein Daesc_002605 [Daldinia eschscholtzii]|uniref:Uncharacterized protein n=1 Tax=Daldinia eschscholtzii TaxID=292717 RepID=A0AAX6MQT2_9PEZI